MSSTSDEEYEAKRAEAERLADLDAQLDPRLAEPLPAGFDADRDIDTDKVERLILDGAPPDAADRIRAGELRWMLTGFDEDGRAKISIINAATGEEVGGVLAHWSAIAAR
jgi:hypothetical protein